MTNTPNLALPFLAAAQAQKHVTVNEVLSLIDALAQIAVNSVEATSPPATPAEGNRHIIGSGATGAWSGWDNSIALFSGGAWLRLTPQVGWMAWDAGFILSHLFLTGKLRDAGLYFLDLEALFQQDKQAFSAASMVQSYHNLLMGLKCLPPSSRKHFGMDFNKWYPLPRRLMALYRIRKTAQEDIQHCRKSLDAVVDRFGISGGQIT